MIGPASEKSERERERRRKEKGERNNRIHTCIKSKSRFQRGLRVDTRWRTGKIKYTAMCTAFGLSETLNKR